MAQFAKGGGGFDVGALKGAMMGGGGFGGGGNGNGITTSRSIGINYNDQWSKKIDFRSSYFFSQSDNLLKQSSSGKHIFRTILQLMQLLKVNQGTGTRVIVSMHDGNIRSIQ
jgi:hypothetical protein